MVGEVLVCWGTGEGEYTGHRGGGMPKVLGGSGEECGEVKGEWSVGESEVRGGPAEVV